MKLAVIPGDGIGPEVVAEGLKVLRGVVPDVEVPGDHLAGDGFDDHLLELVAHSFPGTANVDPTTRKEREDDRLIAARSR